MLELVTIKTLVGKKKSYCCSIRKISDANQHFYMIRNENPNKDHMYLKKKNYENFYQSQMKLL